MDSNKAEILAKWYLRFNGYFLVENYIIHAAEDKSRISRGAIGNHTETDILGIRHKFSKEVTGILEIENDENLLANNEYKIDHVIVEVKTGNKNTPNKVWQKKKIDPIKYMVRFSGFVPSEAEIDKIAEALLETSLYEDPNHNYISRFIIISESKVNEHWNQVTNILFSDIYSFLIDVRGNCWIEEKIGRYSIHYQWHPLINKIFTVINNDTLDRETKYSEIQKIMN